MKLSFSTNGWHDYSWNDFLKIAAGNKFVGIEIHDILSERFSGEGAPFSQENIYKFYAFISHYIL